MPTKTENGSITNLEGILFSQVHMISLTCKTVQRQDIGNSYVGSTLKLPHNRQNEKYCFQCLLPHLPEDSIHHPSLLILMWETSIFKIMTIIIQILFMSISDNSTILSLISYNPQNNQQADIIIASSQMRKLRNKFSDLPKVTQLVKEKNQDLNLVMCDSKVCAFNNLTFLLEEVTCN